MSDRYNVINQEEPRRQSVAVNGIPCTARHCVTQLNRLTQENEKLKEENMNKELSKKEIHIGKLVVYGQLQLLAELKEENTGDNK